MNHMEFAAAESAALEPCKGERWLEALERLLGFNLDGDQQKDGYSLDWASEMFDEGKSLVEAHNAIVASMGETQTGRCEEA